MPSKTVAATKAGAHLTEKVIASAVRPEKTATASRSWLSVHQSKRNSTMRRSKEDRSFSLRAAVVHMSVRAEWYKQSRDR